MENRVTGETREQGGHEERGNRGKGEQGEQGNRWNRGNRGNRGEREQENRATRRKEGTGVTREKGKQGNGRTGIIIVVCPAIS